MLYPHIVLQTKYREAIDNAFSKYRYFSLFCKKNTIAFHFVLPKKKYPIYIKITYLSTPPPLQSSIQSSKKGKIQWENRLNFAGSK